MKGRERRLLHVPAATARTKVLGEGRVEATLSTEADDRDGDVIRQSGWELANFHKHPVLIGAHSYQSVEAQIGEWHRVRVEGRRLLGVAEYYIDSGNSAADWAWELARRGKAAYSVGFIPIEFRERPGGRGYEFVRQELLEVSHVVVPANAEALQAAGMAKGTVANLMRTEIYRLALDDLRREARAQREYHGFRHYRDDAPAESWGRW